MTKVCVKCLADKPMSEFNNDRTRKDGKFPYCKICKSSSDKQWVEADNDRVAKRASRSKQWREDNPEKARLLVKNWKLSNLERAKHLDKKAALWSHYRLTIDQYEKMIADQGGKCFICHRTSKLVVDHDHSCCPNKTACGNCNRKLLCFRCNTLLGLANDDLLLLKSAIEYLGG